MHGQNHIKQDKMFFSKTLIEAIKEMRLSEMTEFDRRDFCIVFASYTNRNN